VLTLKIIIWGNLMSKTISLTVSDDQYEFLSKAADASNMNIPTYIRNELFKLDSNHIDIDLLFRQKISELDIGDTFTIKQLMLNEWSEFSKSERLSFGRLLKFNNNYKNYGLKFVGNNSSNLAVYKKVKLEK
jgi:protein tyrosine phosphatase